MTAKKKSPSKKKSATKKLPAFGLASEILQNQSEISTKANNEITTEEETPELNPSVDPSSDIFAFADSLNQNSESEGVQDTSPVETWVTFALLEELYALPTASVQEILRVGNITRVPQAPESVRGISNVRGRVIPIVDFRIRLGLSPTKINYNSRILVVESHRTLIGFLVESVHQVVQLRQSEIQEAPPDIITSNSDYYLGVVQRDEKLLILLDADRLLAVRDNRPPVNHSE